MRVEDLDIPERLKSVLLSEGFRELWPPQEEAIKAGLLNGENIIVSTPTASGKTLLAILIAGKQIMEKYGKVIYVTPLRALASEKYNEFSLLKKADPKINIMISTGDFDSPGTHLSKADLLILTNEKFDSLMRHGISWIEKVGLFIFDEVHMIGDDSRGGTLEFSIINVLNKQKEPQILALSATISNFKELGEWLKAKTVNLNWRPVKLKEGIYSRGRIFFSDHSVKTLRKVSGDPALDLSLDGIEKGGQVLLFAETRKKAVSVIKKLAPYIERGLSEKERSTLKKISEEKALIDDETHLGKTLKEVVRKGVAFHHAGLPYTHRKLVEEAFRQGYIKVLAATPTLAAGVNLPARRVIILSAFRYSSFGYEPISTMEFKQMAGRAGRPKYDEEGEAILVARDEYMVEPLFERYIKGTPEPILSKLNMQGISTYLLAYVSANPGSSFSDVKEFFSKSLLRKQKGLKYTMAGILEASRFLADNELITEKGKLWYPTKLGKRISTLYITPETGVALKRSLKEIRNSTDVQLSALLTIVSTPDFEPKIGSRKTTEILKLVSSGISLPRYAYYSLNDWVRSFLALKAWIEEESESNILEQYSVEPGDLYRAVENAEWICYSFSEIAKILEDFKMAKELKILTDRIKYGVKTELIEITKLEGVGRVRGRILYKAGIRKPGDIKLIGEDSLSKLPKIGPKLAKKLLEQVRHL